MSNTGSKGGKTDIIYMDTQYSISTRDKNGVKDTTVYMNGKHVKKDRYGTLPMEIQAVINDPFKTDLISLLSPPFDDNVQVLERVTALLAEGRTHLDTYSTYTRRTALMQAVRFVPVAIPLLQSEIKNEDGSTAGFQKPDASMVDKDGYTALMWANGRRPAVDHLLALCTDYARYINVQDKRGQTALLQAVIRNDVYTIQTLSKLPGIDPNLVDKTGQSVMTIFNAKMNARVDSNADVAVLTAISGIPGMQNDIVDPERGTLLMRAIVLGLPDIIRNLLDRPNANLDINHQDNISGRTALMWLCYNPASIAHDIVIDLLRKLTTIPGVLPNLISTQGRQSAFIDAARQFSTSAVFNILKTIPGIDINLQDVNGKTALMYMSSHYAGLTNSELDALLSSFDGADPNIQDFKGQTMLMNRRCWMRLEYFTRHFPTMDPNIRDHEGFTAFAMYARDPFIVHPLSISHCMKAFIVNLRCDTSIGTNRGQTPLAFLISNGNEIGLRLLLESGKPLGKISVRDWIRTSDGQQLTAVSGLLFGYLQSQIKHERPTIIGNYYYSHSREQKNLNEIEAWYRNLARGLLMGGTNTLSMDDTSDDATSMDLETSINFVDRNQTLQKEVLRIRKYLSTVNSTVPEINTRVINDNLRTPIMYAVDQVLDSLPEHQDGNDTMTRHHIERVRFLLEVFPPKYTNVYIQDRDSKDLLQRLTRLLRYESCLTKYEHERIDLIDDHMELPPLVKVIREYISASVIDHVPLTRDVTIAPMMGMVPCNASRFSAADNEINIWVSGEVSCCIPMAGFIRDETDISCPLYLPTDSRFCALLQERDELSSTEPISMFLPSWWGMDDRRHTHTYGVKMVPESQSLMYQLIRLI
mgnify:CR=1 FL=1